MFKRNQNENPTANRTTHLIYSKQSHQLSQKIWCIDEQIYSQVKEDN